MLPPQSPDLNPIKNLWGEMKTKVHAIRPTYLEGSESLAKEEWAGIAQETSVTFV